MGNGAWMVVQKREKEKRKERKERLLKWKWREHDDDEQRKEGKMQDKWLDEREQACR